MSTTYIVQECLGRGGFGSVYSAIARGEANFQKPVALKLLHATTNPDLARRLRDEARMLSMVRHRSVVQVDGIVRVGDRWGVVMERVTGADLAAIVDHKGALPPAAALVVAAEVAAVLHVAWNAPGPDGRPLHLLHRDVKPSNILISTHGDVKLMDFGIARAEFEGREAETRSMAFGSIDYMSPERLVFADGAPADVYALGAVLAELLTGERVGRTSPAAEKHGETVAIARRRVHERVGDRRVGDLVAEMLAWEEESRPSARDVEIRALALAREAEGPSLREWAERALLDVMAGVLPERDEMYGVEIGAAKADAVAPRLLVQEPRVAPSAPPPRTVPWSGAMTRRGAGGLTLGCLGVAVVGGVAAAAALALWAGFRIPVSLPDQAPKEPVHSPVVAAPTPAPPVTPTESPRPRPAAARPSQRASEAPAVVEPAAAAVVEPTPAPVTEPPAPLTAWGRVAIEGDAGSVTLEAGGKEYPAGEVPVGSYTVRAVFGVDPARTAGKVTVLEGRTSTLRCASEFRRCVER